MKRVMITGGGGYIGSVLVKQLLDDGYDVVALDRFFFGDEILAPFASDARLTKIKRDIRDVEDADFAGIDAVCDLAALSNDPSGEIDRDLTYAINYAGRVHVAETAKRAGVSRYVLSSSCSVYGTGKAFELDEHSPTAPLTIYAKSTLQAEEETLALADDAFTVTALRNATVFGLSRRMRFDLVVNLMTLHAVEKGRITVMGGGRQWRPLVHVRDVARAFQAVIEGDHKQVNGEVFNVGMTNLQVRSVAYIVRETLPFPLDIQIAPDDADKRDYNVSFEKMRNVLGYQADYDVADGVSEIYEALKLGDVEQTPRTSTVNWYRTILDAKSLIDRIQLGGRII